MCLSAAPTFFFRGSAFNDACADTAPVLSVTNFFGYNPRSEVTEAVMGDDTYGYAYDPTGSRIVTTESTETTEHLANALTPYTNILYAPASLRLTREADGNPTLHDASCNRNGVCMPGNRYACYAASALNPYTGITDY